MDKPGGAASALLIEDEQAVRRATAQALELGGFAVTACGSAEEALPLITRDFAGVVVSDVRLPALSGLDVLARIDVVAIFGTIGRHMPCDSI